MKKIQNCLAFIRVLYRMFLLETVRWAMWTMVLCIFLILKRILCSLSHLFKTERPWDYKFCICLCQNAKWPLNPFPYPHPILPYHHSAYFCVPQHCNDLRTNPPIPLIASPKLVDKNLLRSLSWFENLFCVEILSANYNFFFVTMFGNDKVLEIEWRLKAEHYS